MYKKLVFYLEACESGSMFQGLLPTNQNIYVTTASNAVESSWGTYCPPDDMVNGVEINSCLGDLYSVNWMEDADKAGSMSESLQTQFNTVQQETTQSHVMQYGEVDWTNMAIGQFEGNGMEGKKISTVATKSAHKKPLSSNVDSRDAKLNYNYYKYLRAKTQTASHAAGRELIAEIESRIASDILFTDLARAVAGAERTEQMVHEHIGSPAKCGDCCKTVMETLREQCNAWNDYSLKYTRVAVNLCHHMGNSAHGTKHILNAVKALCPAQ
jgi:legumain